MRTNKPLRCLPCLAALLSVVLTTGCGDGLPKRVPVSGKVIIDGEPLTFGNIRFVPEGHRSSYGKLDSEGRFSLSCFDEGDGAVTGTHRVQISASEILAGSKVKWHAPKKYSGVSKSGLVIDITEPTEDVLIELTWDGENQGGKK